MFSKKLKCLAVASSLFFLISCTLPVVRKHWGGSNFKHLKTPKKTYVILVSGAFPEEGNLDDILQDKALEVYESFKDPGLSDEDIYFLATSRDERMEKCDDFFTYRSFSNVRKELSDKMTEEDLLVFFYIGHGGGGNMDYSLLKNVDLSHEPQEPDYCFSIKTLEAELDMLKYSHAIIVLDSCYSGFVAKTLGKKNRVGVSVACKEQMSWIFSEFSTYLIKALTGEKEADKNDDNKVSLEEAVYHAAKKDPWSKKKFGISWFFPEPQMYYEEIDPSKVFLKE